MRPLVRRRPSCWNHRSSVTASSDSLEEFIDGADAVPPETGTKVPTPDAVRLDSPSGLKPAFTDPAEAPWTTLPVETFIDPTPGAAWVNPKPPGGSDGVISGIA